MSKYAICDVCEQPMMPRGGCTVTGVELNGEIYQRLKYGDNGEPAGPCCGDCNCMGGKLHHPGCDQEVCPRCRMQLIGCGCLFTNKVKLDDVPIQVP